MAIKSMNFFRPGNKFPATRGFSLNIDESGIVWTGADMGIISRSDGSIFAWTGGTGIGRFRYDESIDGITGASCYYTDLSGLPSRTILSIYVDQDNHQWFGTPEGVTCHKDWETRTGWKVYSDTDGLIH